MAGGEEEGIEGVVQETPVRSLGGEDPLEQEMATHSSLSYDLWWAVLRHPPGSLRLPPGSLRLSAKASATAA